MWFTLSSSTKPNPAENVAISSIIARELVKRDRGSKSRIRQRYRGEVSSIEMSTKNYNRK